MALEILEDIKKDAIIANSLKLKYVKNVMEKVSVSLTLHNTETITYHVKNAKELARLKNKMINYERT